ncbi:MAG TPA: hypothetical protein VF183_11565 [Acidimicrobiales bacterium]
MVNAPSTDVELVTTRGESRPLADWLTTFPLALGIVDPYTHESAWLLDTIARIFRVYQGADVRVAWLVTGPADDAKRFLGPLGDEFLTFCDPERSVVKALDLTTLPAFVAIRQDGSLLGAAQGWDPPAWNAVAEDLTRLTGWSRIVIPGPGDPVAYPGTPALG